MISFFKLPSASPRCCCCCVSAKGWRNASASCRRLCKLSLSVSGACRLQSKENWTLLTSLYRQPWPCFARRPLFGFAADILRDTSQGQPRVVTFVLVRASRVRLISQAFLLYENLLSQTLFPSRRTAVTQRGDVTAAPCKMMISKDFALLTITTLFRTWLF